MACRICFSTDEVKLCGDCHIGYYCSCEHLLLHECSQKQETKKRPIFELEPLNEQPLNEQPLNEQQKKLNYNPLNYNPLNYNPLIPCKNNSELAPENELVVIKLPLL